MTNSEVDMAVIRSAKWRMTHAGIPAGPVWPFLPVPVPGRKNPTGYNPGVSAHNGLMHDNDDNISNEEK